MPKKIVVTAIGNRIEYATTNGKDLITGKHEDITDDAIKAVFQHLMDEHRRNNREEKSFGYGFEGLSEIHYHPPKNKTLEKMKEDG